MTGRPRVLIEDWLPVDVIGAESMRERGASSALPPLYFLHVWWARRPLLTSRAAILASVLPTWSESWPANLREKFPTRESYHSWFIKLCGIFGDPVAGRKLILWAKARGIKLKQPPYSHKRGFTVSPSSDHLELLGDLLEFTWGTRRLHVMDPFSGGGSIPFESLRYGFDTVANELNPIASVILKATLDYPLRFGSSLARDVEVFGKRWTDAIEKKLAPFFPVQGSESIFAYIWARTVRCPYTGKPLPLSPNWWLLRGGTPHAMALTFDPRAEAVRFTIARGKEACTSANPDRGTIKKGDAISPWAADQAVDGDYIKAESKAGRMAQQLCAIGFKKQGTVEFRAPTREDLEAVEAASVALRDRQARWESLDLIPREARATSRADWAAEVYGFKVWLDSFAPRQVLALCTAIEELAVLRRDALKDLEPDRAKAICTLLAIALDKALDYNSKQVQWDSTRSKVAHAFTRHDFGMKWSFAEFDAAHSLFPWAVSQVSDAFGGICQLATRPDKLDDRGVSLAAELNLRKGSAGQLSGLNDRSLHAIVTDPPYYDNVNYADCSDYFYVWMKRSLGEVHPELFQDELTNKDDEAIANPSRFAEVSPKKKRQLALEDYQRKMAGAFREMHRVLSDDGALTVMFTHKKVEAWDTLATSLIGAGFAIHSSWPVHTESEHSLHQAKKNAAQSTILLTCRKREPSAEPVWWDDIKGNVRRAAREKAEEFERQGIRGVDLYIATFGPTLAILSENWPVLTSDVDERTGEPKPLRPEVALDLAREEVVELRKQGLLLGRSVTFDPFTDWYLMAWDAFMAQEFPGDEARKLALALGLDLEKQVIAEKKLVSKKGKTVTLQQPSARRKRGMVDPDQRTFTHWIDAAHTAMLLYKEDGSQACQHFLRETGLQNDSTFKALIQALLQAIPRTKQKGKFARPEAEVLDAMRLAFFDDLPVPPDEEVEIKTLQGDLFDGASVAAEKPDDGDIEDEDEPDEDEEDDE